MATRRQGTADDPVPLVADALSRWLGPFAIVVLLVLIWISFFELTAHERRQTLKAADAGNANLALALEQYTIRLLKNADAVTQLVANEFETGARGEALRKVLLARAANNDAFLEVLVADPRGRLLMSSSAPSLVQAQTLERPAQAQAGPVQLGVPIPLPGSARFVVPMMRAIRGPGGAEGGWAVVLLDSTRFMTILDGAQMDKDTVVLLSGPEGWLYGRWSNGPLARDPQFIQARKLVVLDAAARLVKQRDFSDYPLRATVGTDRNDVLRDFAQRRQIYLVVCVAFTLAALLLAAVMVVLDRRRASWARQLGQARGDLARANSTLERDVDLRTLQLQQANSDLQAFSYSVAHDLRAPLSSIAGFSRELERALEGGEQPRLLHFARRIGSNATHMGHITEGLLALAQLGRRPLVAAPLDLSAMAATVVAALREREPDRVVDVQVQPGLSASGDAALVRQVLENLLGNAWKFLGRTDHARIEVGQARLAARCAAFFVQDNGTGFDMAHAGQLFKPFHRLHTQEEFPGTGIGLATVQRIVQLHGGTVWVESAPGTGTTFFFTLQGAAPAA
jgi:signal transduction histidine kinase